MTRFASLISPSALITNSELLENLRRSAWTMLLDELPEPPQTNRVGNGRRHGVRTREHPEQPTAHDVGPTSLTDGGEDLARDHVGLIEETPILRHMSKYGDSASVLEGAGPKNESTTLVPASSRLTDCT